MSYAHTPPWVLRRRLMRMGGGRSGRSGRGYGPRGGYPMGPGPFFGGRPRVARGDVRLAVLQLLGEEPMHGYQIMQELTDRSGGVWRPSPGSIYPTLQQLEDEGLIQADRQDGKNVFSLTEPGISELEGSDTPPVWERFGKEVDDSLIDLRDVGFQVGAAVMQIARAGSESQVAKAKEILEETRRRIYEILA
ncbi:MAG: PadR family transcriptional regulator [Acidimicrobiia bacterium]